MTTLNILLFFCSHASYLVSEGVSGFLGSKLQLNGIQYFKNILLATIFLIPRLCDYSMSQPDDMARISFFLPSELQDHSNYWLHFFYLHVQAKKLGRAGIEPRSSRSASDRSVHYTMAPGLDKNSVVFCII